LDKVENNIIFPNPKADGNNNPRTMTIHNICDNDCFFHWFIKFVFVFKSLSESSGKQSAIFHTPFCCSQQNTINRVACVASVPVPHERNSGHGKEFFCIRAARKMRREQKSGRRGVGVGREKEGTLARKPVDFEKRPLVFTVEFIY